MEKLIKLLNEYEDCQWYIDDYGRISEGGWWSEGQDSWICSKKFGFIKWLVENNKIDEKKIDTRLVKYVESHYDEEGYWIENSYEDYSYTNTLLMILSISETPIDDLISYLK